MPPSTSNSLLTRFDRAIVFRPAIGRLVDSHAGNLQQSLFCFLPYPDSDVFGRGIFQSRDIIQTVMIESLEKRLKHLFQAWEALTPAQQVHATIVANGTMYTQAEIVEM